MPATADQTSPALAIAQPAGNFATGGAAADVMLVCPVIDPHGIYSKERLAAILGVAPRTVERMSGVDAAAVEEKASDGTGSAGELPPPFYVGRRPYWMGAALLQEFTRRQNIVLRAKGA